MSWQIKLSIYGAGDASSSGAFASLTPFLWQQIREVQKTVTNEAVAGVAQLDGSTHPTMRWVLDPAFRLAPQELGETNTGDPQGLVDFCAWANARCPANVEVLVLSGHGLAFQDGRTESYLTRAARAIRPQILRAKKLFGSNADFYSRAVLVDKNDFVSVPELKGALSKIAGLASAKSIGVLVFDACLMSNIELLYEIHESVDTVVGSVDEISGAGLNLSGAANLATTRLRNGATVNSSDMAVIFSEAYTPSWATDSCVAVSLDNKSLAVALKAFKKFVLELSSLDLSDPDTNSHIRSALSDGSRRLVRYQSNSLADIAAFCAAFTTDSFPKKVCNSSIKFRTAVEPLILSAKLGSDYENATGISVFSPTSLSEFERDRADYKGLSFANETGWIEFLDKLYS